MEVVNLTAQGLLNPLDLHKAAKQKKVIASTDSIDLDTSSTGIGNGLQLDLSFLPFAAKQYNISLNIMDYILVPVFVIPASIPNRNTVGFLLEDLARFNVELGMQHYKTWRGKPTFYEHKNDNPVEANGIILDTVLNKSQKGNYWKVINYMAFDRTKYTDLVQRVIRREVSTYSMGATVTHYECSICGRKIGNCNHFTKRDRHLKLIDTGLDRPEVAFMVGRNPVGFETSIVEDPAWVVAQNDFVQEMK